MTDVRGAVRGVTLLRQRAKVETCRLLQALQLIHRQELLLTVLGLRNPRYSVCSCRLGADTAGEILLEPVGRHALQVSLTE